MCRLETLIFLSHPVVRASGYPAVFAVEDDGPGGLSSQAALDVLFCLVFWREQHVAEKKELTTKQYVALL